MYVLFVSLPCCDFFYSTSVVSSSFCYSAFMAWGIEKGVDEETRAGGKNVM